jgi:thiamine biosynthesis lipoprotein
LYLYAQIFIMRYLLFVLPLLIFACTSLEQEPIYLKGNAQGSTFSIIYYDSLNRDVSKEVDSILKHIDYSLSLWESNSLVSRFNKADTNLVLLTDTFGYFFHTLMKSAEFHRVSNGMFDPSLHPAIKAYGFGDNKELSHINSDSLKALVGFNKIQFRVGRNKQLLLSKEKGMSVDFNGIAQGYTVDVLVGFFEGLNIKQHLIEVGGEIRVGANKPSGKNWLIGIDKPMESSEREIQTKIELEGRALATSGNYRKFKVLNGEKVGHTFNALTAKPAVTDLLSVTVIADNCEIADAMATTFMTFGKKQTIKWLKYNPTYNLEVMLVTSGNETEDFKVWTSTGFPKAFE